MLKLFLSAQDVEANLLQIVSLKVSKSRKQIVMFFGRIENALICFRDLVTFRILIYGDLEFILASVHFHAVVVF